jgi:signal transduction histidine kinase
MIRIKTKLSLGLSFLFFVIVLLIATGLYFLNRLSLDEDNILKDNYNSLEYVNGMESALDKIAARDGEPGEHWKYFEERLKLQEQNITEPGEKDMTENVRESFEDLKKEKPVTAKNTAGMRSDLRQIGEINRAAIVRKNQEAQETARQAKLLLTLITVCCFIFSFIFIVNFPGYIADPIHRLTESIRQIADKNYSERLYFKSHDEFGELAEAFNNMASRLDAYEHSNLAELLFEKRRLETLLDNMTDAVLVLDENRRVLFCNPMACQLMGVKKTDLTGKYAPDAALHNDLLRALLKDSNTEPLKIYYEKKESFFQKESIAVRVERPNFPADAGNVILLKNITPFKELDQAKTNFIATISHELKTPISSIKMSLLLLEDGRIGSLNEEQQRLLKHIREDSQRLLKITGELLDLAQVETGNIRLNRIPVRPVDLIRFAIDAVQMQADQKKVEIRQVMPETVPELELDPDKTTWVLINLLTNAIRYAPEGSVVQVALQVEGSEMVLSVSDSGSGIAPEHQKHLFERFYQSPGSGGHSPESTGLGLSIAKDFIVAQGGRIWVDSKPKEGTSFRFAFPVQLI